MLVICLLHSFWHLNTIYLYPFKKNLGYLACPLLDWFCLNSLCCTPCFELRYLACLLFSIAHLEHQKCCLKLSWVSPPRSIYFVVLIVILGLSVPHSWLISWYHAPSFDIHDLLFIAFMIKISLGSQVPHKLAVIVMPHPFWSASSILGSISLLNFYQSNYLTLLPLENIGILKSEDKL